MILTVAQMIGPPPGRILSMFLAMWVLTIIIGMVALIKSFIRTHKNQALVLGVIVTVLGLLNPLVFFRIWNSMYPQIALIQASPSLLGLGAICMSLVRRPFKNGFCTHCGYDLQGSIHSTHCPECGEKKRRRKGDSEEKGTKRGHP